MEATGAAQILWFIKDLTASEFTFLPAGEGEMFTFVPEHGGAFEVKVEARAGDYVTAVKKWVFVATP